MPNSQRAEFNRLIGVLNRANRLIGPLVILIAQLVEKLEIRHGWLVSLELWKMHAEELVAYLDLHTKEPVTKSEYRRLLGEARSEDCPASDLAEVLLERFSDWREADYEVAEEGAEPEVSDAAWERIHREQTRELVALVTTGAIAGKKKGRQTLVNAGAFYDWLGEAVPLEPDWGYEYEVFPDKQASFVKRLQTERQHVRDLLQQSPFGAGPSWLNDVRPVIVDGKDPDSNLANLSDELRETIRSGIQMHWLEVRIVEILWDEVSEEFGGEDPARPILRQDINEAKAKLKDLSGGMCLGVEPVELSEPTEEMLDDARDGLIKPDDDD